MIYIEYTEYSIEEYLNRSDIEKKLSVTEIAIQMLEAVEEVHKAGFVH